MNTINLDVCGEVGVGKTTVALLVKNILEANGIKCNFSDTEDETQFPIARAVPVVAEKTVVNITVRQFRR